MGRHHVQVICEYIENEIPNPVLMPPDACRIWLGHAVGAFAGNLRTYDAPLVEADCGTGYITVFIYIISTTVMHVCILYWILDESVGSKYIVFPCLSDILAAYIYILLDVISYTIEYASPRFSAPIIAWWSPDTRHTLESGNLSGPVAHGSPAKAHGELIKKHLTLVDETPHMGMLYGLHLSDMLQDDQGWWREHRSTDDLGRWKPTVKYESYSYISKNWKRSNFAETKGSDLIFAQPK